MYWGLEVSSSISLHFSWFPLIVLVINCPSVAIAGLTLVFPQIERSPFVTKFSQILGKACQYYGYFSLSNALHVPNLLRDECPNRKWNTNWWDQCQCKFFNSNEYNVLSWTLAYMYWVTRKETFFTNTFKFAQVLCILRNTTTCKDHVLFSEMLVECSRHFYFAFPFVWFHLKYVL